jgi:hypothetical protein
MVKRSLDRSHQQQSSQFRLALSAALAAPGEFILRAHKVLSMFAASLIAMAPVHAFAQPEDEVSVRERPRPEYDPLGVRFGGFNLHAALDLGVTSSDNIFAEETGEDDDTILSAGLHGRLESGWSRHALAVEAGGVTTSYSDFSSEDHDTSYAGIRGRLDVGANSNLTARARIAHEVEPRTDPDAPAQGIPLVEYDRTELGIGASHTFNRFRVSAALDQAENDYDGAQSYRDFDEVRLTGRLEGEVSPRIGLFVQASSDERDYDNTAGLSSEGATYLVGATINFTDLMQGEVGVGAFERDYDDPAIGSTDGLALSGQLEWYITRLTTLTFEAHRNSEDVVGATTVFPYVESRYGGRVDHELLRNVILSAAAEFGRREYDVIDRDDDFFNANLGVDYLVNRRLVLQGRYTFDQVESDGVDRYRDYEENRFSLGASIRL